MAATLAAPLVAPWLQWSLDFPLLAGAAAALAYYAWVTRRAGRTPRQALLFLGGLAAVVLALASPLHTLGECCLLSAHMVQHVILLLVAPPLLMAGLEGALRRPARGAGPALAALGLLLVNLYAWHWPPFYQAALQSPVLHNAQHVLYLATGLLFWYSLRPLTAPAAAPLWPTVRAGLVIGAAVGMMPLGILLLGAGQPVFTWYARTAPLVGWSPLFDQQVAAVVMLMGGMPVVAAMLLLALPGALTAEHATCAARAGTSTSGWNTRG